MPLEIMFTRLFSCSMSFVYFCNHGNQGLVHYGKREARAASIVHPHAMRRSAADMQLS